MYDFYLKHDYILDQKRESIRHPLHLLYLTITHNYVHTTSLILYIAQVVWEMNKFANK